MRLDWGKTPSLTAHLQLICIEKPHNILIFIVKCKERLDFRFFLFNLSFMQYGVKRRNGKITPHSHTVYSHTCLLEHKFVALMFFFDIDTILRINDYKSMRAKKTFKELALYLMRWQLSTPILAFCVVYLATFGEFWATVIANFIGGLIFFWVDRLIFKGGNNEKS